MTVFLPRAIRGTPPNQRMSDRKKAKIWESFQYQNNQDILHHTECGSLLKIHFTKKIELGRIPSQLQQHFFQHTFNFCINSNGKAACAVYLAWLRLISTLQDRNWFHSILCSNFVGDPSDIIGAPEPKTTQEDFHIWPAWQTTLRAKMTRPQVQTIYINNPVIQTPPSKQNDYKNKEQHLTTLRKNSAKR